ncbi:hypothetical protein EV189_0523 [Motilibacter rhizosphaerae]|uniref:Uncharacterized protein n=1 Tax=Motilibacter rhizosphaerae TaxID=598652 RepID=A0A4Q7NVJ4_9ACTN|nr:hypothetical protein [Motilibacter rhizosphaerae]RZS91286.1 hypothetical protein EV189_0523 [Motilibacter rhizosphaerae]
MTHVRLVVVFNHKFEANLPKLDEILGERFPDRCYVMPFYDGDRDDVIGVYESSYAFQGYLTQARDRIASPTATHYVVMADDMVLNPRFDATNLPDELGLGSGTAWIKGLAPLSDQSPLWMHLRRAVEPFTTETGTEWRRELPEPEEAARLLARHGIVPGAHDPRRLVAAAREVPARRLLRESSVRWSVRYLARGARPLPYPLAVGYSDFMVVPAEVWPRFCHLAGVLAAMGVFVEAGAPTALALAAPGIATEQTSGWHGLEVWGVDGPQEVQRAHDGLFSNLLASFAPRQVYVHPVKLSMWEGPFS